MLRWKVEVVDHHSSVIVFIIGAKSPCNQWVQFCLHGINEYISFKHAMLSRKTTVINVAAVSLAIRDCLIDHTLVITTTLHVPWLHYLSKYERF